MNDTTSYGRIELDAEARLLRFGEKTKAGLGWIIGGVYVLEPAIFDFIPAGVAVSAEKETFPLILEQDHRMFGYPVQGFFVNIGTPKATIAFVVSSRSRRRDNSQQNVAKHDTVKWILVEEGVRV